MNGLWNRQGSISFADVLVKQMVEEAQLGFDPDGIEDRLGFERVCAVAFAIS